MKMNIGVPPVLSDEDVLGQSFDFHQSWEVGSWTTFSVSVVRTFYAALLRYLYVISYQIRVHALCTRVSRSICVTLASIQQAGCQTEWNFPIECSN